MNKMQLANQRPFYLDYEKIKELMKGAGFWSYSSRQQN